MKKIFAILVCIICSLTLLSGCGKTTNGGKGKTEVLRIYNCEDYIAVDDEETEENESCIDAFVEYMKEKGRNVKVEYSTFGTLENMYNELKINPGSYDLICPSEYMIQKMLHEGMLEKFDDSFLNDETNNYNTYASPFIKNLFENTVIDDDLKMSDYSVGYMWGTLGLLYNPETVSDEDMTDWVSLWNKKYKGKSTIKDSIRDTFFLGLAKYHNDELLTLAGDFKSGNITATEYNARITELFNDTNDDTVNGVGKLLTTLKNNVYGLEVDSGKNDMVTGKISINFAWSGDAVYAMDTAEEENDVILNYSVPKQGSNIWFDAWCMPKGANKELAQQFVNFISRPDIAVMNMDYIGYTSPIAGDEVLDYIVDVYGLTNEETDDNPYFADLGYFFDGTLTDGERAKLYSSEINRQFTAQFPTEDIVNRCAVMKFFDERTNAKINEMWEKVKGESIPVWGLILIAVAILLVALAILFFRFKDKIVKPDYDKKEKPLKKGLTVVSKEEIVYYDNKTK